MYACEIHMYTREIHVLHTLEWSTCICRPQEPPLIVKFSPLKTPPPLPWSEIQILTKDSFFGGRPLVSFLLADYIAPMMHYDVLLVLLKAFLIISCGMVLVMRVSVRL